jgi:thiamine phosphate synthase YjbQ (UPF0047 family)
MDFRIINFYLSFKSTGDTDILDITRKVSEKVTESGIHDGQVGLFVPGSTASVTTIEYENGAGFERSDRTPCPGGNLLST